MSVTTRQETAIITPQSDLDGQTSPKLLTTLLPLGKQHQQIIIDLSKISRITSAGLRALLDARQHISDERQMVICTSSPSILSLLKMTGLSRLIDITSSLPNFDR